MNGHTDVAGVVLCHCGEPLELRCRHGHDPEPIQIAERVPHRGHPNRKGMKLGPRTYRPKMCACGATFAPTGPRDVRCPECKAH